MPAPGLGDPAQFLLQLLNLAGVIEHQAVSTMTGSSQQAGELGQSGVLIGVEQVGQGLGRRVLGALLGRCEVGTSRDLHVESLDQIRQVGQGLMLVSIVGPSLDRNVDPVLERNWFLIGHGCRVSEFPGVDETVVSVYSGAMTSTESFVRAKIVVNPESGIAHPVRLPDITKINDVTCSTYRGSPCDTFTEQGTCQHIACKCGFRKGGEHGGHVVGVAHGPVADEPWMIDYKFKAPTGARLNSTSVATGATADDAIDNFIAGRTGFISVCAYRTGSKSVTRTL